MTFKFWLLAFPSAPACAELHSRSQGHSLLSAVTAPSSHFPMSWSSCCPNSLAVSGLLRYSLVYHLYVTPRTWHKLDQLLSGIPTKVYVKLEEHPDSVSWELGCYCWLQILWLLAQNEVPSSLKLPFTSTKSQLSRVKSLAGKSKVISNSFLA